ncbi:MAG TPA: guanine deaminase [Thermoanaerobaculia bacterium]|nr:guanine deaminase [Thermoanaerobaculia bacterium]
MRVFRSRIFSPLTDPFATEPVEKSFTYLPDGYMVVADDGRIHDVGDWSAAPASIQEVAEHLGSSALITPGFVDTHLHAPQLEMIGSYGGHLLEWLNRYTFPTEARFSQASHARTVARALFDQLLRNGTVLALLMSTIHREATEIFFEEAELAGFRGIIGKTMMDRNATRELTEDPVRSYEESRELLVTWHGRGLLRYAITPRFAPTSSPRLLEAAGRLKAEFPDAYVHTHVSENADEVQWVAELFPELSSYAGVYDRYGLLSSRTILAHGVHLTDHELRLLRLRETRIAHCPNSNLFLGSGLFPLQRVLDCGVRVGLGSDIGAGTTPSMFSAMSDAYKVQQVRGVSLSPFQLWYLATLGGAEVLSLDTETGSLIAGKDADFLILDLQATSLLTLRTRHASSIEDLLAGLVFMGDERVVRRSFIKGREVFTREESKA